MPLNFDNVYKHHPSADYDHNISKESICARAKELARSIDQECPDSREKSIAFTQLETAFMWAIASIERSDPCDMKSN